jgi:acetyl-CoA acetyltransferase
MTAPGVAVVGLGHSPVFRRAEVPLGALAVGAALDAIADAGLTPADIDGVTTSPDYPAEGLAPAEGISQVGTAFMIDALRLHPRFVEEGGAIVSQSFAQAVNAIRAGACRYALVFRALHNPDGRYGRLVPQEYATGAGQWIAPYGMSGPTMMAQLIRRYMFEFGGTKEDLGRFVVSSRAYGLRNPNSYWAQHRPESISLDDYMNDRPISSPLGMLDCDLPVQGAAAFVLTSAERALDLTATPAHVLGSAVTPRFYSPTYFPATVEEELSVGREIAANLYQQADIGPDDFDVANLYDGFSAIAPFWADMMGLCEPGDGLAWVGAPSIPLNTSGGNLGNGRMHGIPHLYDGISQVMGRSTVRQVDDAELSLVTIASAHIGGAFVFSNRLP